MNEFIYLIQKYLIFITETTESSAIANFTDGADNMVMHHVVAEINPVQSGSGDPSPSNVRPITGWTGCNVTRCGGNLLPDVSRNSSGYSVTVQFVGNRGTLTGTASSSGGRNVFRSEYFSLRAGTYYFKRFDVNDNGKSVPSVYLQNNTTILSVNGSTGQFTLSADSTKMNLGFNVTSGQEYNYTALFVIATTNISAYEPYTSTSLTIDWTTEAGTVYGGTIDVATGLLTVNNVTVDMGDLTWGKSTGFFFVNLTTVAIGTNNILCSQYKTVPSSNDGAFRSRTDDCIINTFIGGHGIRVKDTSRDSLSGDEFKTAMSGVQLVYELATPQTYQLTPQEVKTLLGTNNVWTDIGNVSVTYVADTKLYIEKLTMPTEDDLVANQAITSGKYFMIGNSLYLALANIASGAQITIGTNAQRVSLADALNTINS